jgi:outer membrane lipoprotein-sorting protein
MGLIRVHRRSSAAKSFLHNFWRSHSRLGLVSSGKTPQEAAMFRSLVTTILCVPAFLFIPAAAQDTELTVDQIVEKHTQALGGADKLKAIQSETITGKVVLMGGQLEAPVTMSVKRPASMRMEMTVQDKSYIQAFDGATAWTVNPFTGPPDPQKSNDEDTQLAKDDADVIEGSLVDYKAKGNTVELVGKEEVEGSPAYKLKVTKKSGNVEYEFLDAQTFLPIRTSGKRKQMGQEMEFESSPGNYKPVNGVMMPHSLAQKVNGNPMMQLTIEKIEVNTPIDDSVFKMPEKPKEEKKDAAKQ